LLFELAHHHMNVSPHVDMCPVPAPRPRYLSPNGYLQLSPVPQCSGYFATDSCSLSSQYGYRGVLGPLITDFVPNKDNGSSGVYYRTDSQTYLCASWIGLPVWGRSPALQYSTRLCVYSSGAFAWGFEGNFSAPPLPSSNGPIWMVRGPGGRGGVR
jgi:hypothetical protein